MTISQTPPLKITKSYVDRLSTPATGQAFVRDMELKGFAVRATSTGAKSFILEKRINYLDISLPGVIRLPRKSMKS